MRDEFDHIERGNDVSVSQGMSSLSKMHILQSVQWPDPTFHGDTRPFMRLKRAVGLSMSQSGLSFGVGGQVALNGYYNLLNLGKWRAFCDDLPISLWLKGCGRFQLTVWVSCPGKPDEKAYCEELNLAEEYLLRLDKAKVENPHCLVWFDMLALSDGRLDDFAWLTEAQPLQNPKLTLVITTFQREAEVAKTIERFVDFRERSTIGEHLKLIVVDNGNSLVLPHIDAVEILQNRNFGGSAGFSRGLLEAQQQKATHCLFMDDDASVQMEAIARTWAFLAYSTDPKTAVAGAMVNAQRPWEIWENGATFDRSCRPRYTGLDLRRVRWVFRMEHETTGEQPDRFYAGWWFFAFPLSEVRHLAFPFFVRGDDVSFSLTHGFRFVLLPGVASVQDSFTEKASPQTWYLDMRSHLVHHLSVPEMEVSWWALQKMFLSFYLRTVLRFHYGSLSAVNLAIEDVLRGPEFFVDNIDMVERRKILKSFGVNENWQPANARAEYRRTVLNRVARAILLVSLNGHLLPFADVLGSRLTIPILHRENYREVYGAREITYVNGDEDMAYTVKRSRRRFFWETWRLARNSLQLLVRYRDMQSVWRKSYPRLTSEVFWRDKLGLS